MAGGYKAAWERRGADGAIVWLSYTWCDVNHNSCIVVDGIPVTLRFADAISEIFTGIPATDTVPPLPFRTHSRTDAAPVNTRVNTS